MKKLENKKQVNALVFLFACTYMVSYITRTNYGAIISEMQTATTIPRSLLSMALTGSFITYGTGQIISGMLGDRISPKKLVTCGLVITSVMNILISVCKSPYQMLAVWCVNGFAQSLMWPPMVKILTELLTEHDYQNAITKVCWGSSIGTILVYLISPFLISVGSWRWVFVCSAAAGIIMCLVWNRYSYEIPLKKQAAAAGAKGQQSFLSPMILGIMAAIVLQGMLRDGVTTWMPSYIAETYKLSNVISILTGVVLPVFSIVSFQLVTKLYEKKFQNDPVVCAGVCFVTGAAAALILFGITGKSAVFSVLLSALLTGCMHGVNLMLICMIPPFFKKYGNVSTVSGVLNACTYVGSAASTYGIAVLSEKIGWNQTIFVWFLIAIDGAVLCFGCVKAWRRKF